MKNYIYLVQEDDYERGRETIVVTTDLRLALRKCTSTETEIQIWLDNEELERIDGSYNPENIKRRFEKSTYLKGYNDDLIQEAGKILDEYYIMYNEERLENERHQAEMIRNKEMKQLAQLKAKYES